MPYSDPLADGPVIHEAGTRALAAGASVAGVLEVARALAPSVPVVLMCYSNMVFAPGAEAFVERLAQTGACGLIVPDLPLEEAAEVREACDARGLALVLLVAPTTPAGAAARDRGAARGFLYTVSVVGTTGERDALQERFAEVVARAKASTEVPVALGFGISTPEQARQAADAGADGVIVGTRLVRAAGEGEIRQALSARSSPSSRRDWRRPISERPLGFRRHGTDPHRHRRPRRVDRALGTWSQGLRRFPALRRDHPRRRHAEDPLELPPRPS